MLVTTNPNTNWALANVVNTRRCHERCSEAVLQKLAHDISQIAGNVAKEAGLRLWPHLSGLRRERSRAEQSTLSQARLGSRALKSSTVYFGSWPKRW